jgi:itaconate CoA-transferase
VLDVKDAADRALPGAMIGRANVFVQNLVPGAAARLGLDAVTLRQARPSLIHCSISGYGEDGPDASRKVCNLLIQCETWLVLSTGTPETPSRRRFPSPTSPPASTPTAASSRPCTT